MLGIRKYFNFQLIVCAEKRSPNLLPDRTTTLKIGVDTIVLFFIKTRCPKLAGQNLHDY